MKVLVAYDGTLQSKEALRYGLGKVRENGGELTLLHVFPAGLFVDYDATPNAEAMARHEASARLEEARAIIGDAGKGLRTRIVSEDGDPEEEILDYAKAKAVDVLLCPPRMRSVIRKYKKALGERRSSEGTIPGGPENITASVLVMQ